MSHRIDDKTLELLRCPNTGSRLTVVENQTLQQINQWIESGDLLDCSGKQVDSPLDGALMNEDQSLAMPIRLGVISLSSDRAIPLRNREQPSD